MARPKRSSQPRTPAPVSGPGAASRRTDGGPGSKTQPIRVPTGGPYGQAQAIEAQQQGAPMSAGPSPQAPNTPTSGPGPTSSALPPGLGGGVFGPTERPTEPITTGLPRQGQGGQAPDVDAMLRELYRLVPHPQLLNLIKRG